MRESLLIALPKGRLFDVVLGLFARAGIETDGSQISSRKLTFSDREGLYEFVALKPADVPIYVESGAVDAGIVGSDVLRELDCDLYEPLDLRIGVCTLVVAAPAGMTLTGQHLRVATKYPRTAARFFAERNAHAHIVRLEGSVEIAPLLGLADVIVDLVETGRTLRENGLEPMEQVARISAKLIVNRTAMKTRNVAVRALIASLDTVVYEDS